MSQLELDPVLVTPLRRPEPRPRKRRDGPTPTSPVVIKTAVGIVAAAMLFAFAGRIAAFAIEPVVATMNTGKEIRALEVLKGKEAQQNAQLQQDIHYLKTRSGVEQEARRRGWVRPGEVALAIAQPDPPPPPPKVNKQPVRTAAAHPVTFSDRVQTVLDTCLAVFGGPARPR